MDVVLGTAGHIDHGKTTLVQALTGINCDRLDEEKRRGITIELGFAWLDLPDGRRMGIVDVPGHERFVKNMLAGASGIDCVLLIIAADEGVMPQTREHLDICALLGVKHGLTVLTKTDLVDQDWLNLVKEDTRDFLKGSFLEQSPILPVSSATGSGIEELRSAIFQLVSSLAARKGSDIFRLPIDRVFTLKGIGAIATGTIISGQCRQGNELVILPKNLSARARSLQSHGQTVPEARQGQRCAINLQGVEAADLERGDIAARPGSLFPAGKWMAFITCLPSAPHPLRQRMELRFHHGTQECAARILFRDRDTLPPGQSALAELHFSQPMTGIFGDHCVFRAHSPLRAIAGGIIIDPLLMPLRKRDPDYAVRKKTYGRLAEMAIETERKGKNQEKHAEELTRLALFLRGAPGADLPHLKVATGLPEGFLCQALERLHEKGGVILWDAANNYWVEKTVFEQSLEKCLARTRELHEREPIKAGFAPNAIYAGWGDKLPERYNQKVIEAALDKKLLDASGNGLKLASHAIELNEAQNRIKDILQRNLENNLTPPDLDDILANAQIDPKMAQTVLNYLCESGKLVKVKENLYYSSPVLDQMLARAREWFATHQNLNIADIKTLFNLSRKYAIPFLEYMDAIKMTIRVGNEHRLR